MDFSLACILSLAHMKADTNSQVWTFPYAHVLVSVLDIRVGSLCSCLLSVLSYELQLPGPSKLLAPTKPR